MSRPAPVRLYLTKRSIPELAVLPTHERDRIWNAALRKVFRRWQWWLALVVFAAAAYAFLSLVGALRDGSASGAVRMLLAAAFGAAGGLAVAQIGIRLMRIEMREMLRTRQRSSAEQSLGQPGR